MTDQEKNAALDAIGSVLRLVARGEELANVCDGPEHADLVRAFRCAAVRAICAFFPADDASPYPKG